MAVDSTTVTSAYELALLDGRVAANPLRRWVEPHIADRASFLAEHPECALSAEQLAALEPEIWWRASKLDASTDPDRQAELRAEIRLRVLEAATAYRDLDARSGQPIYDYLKQSKRYIVWHAAGKVSSALRRQRTARATLQLVANVVHDDQGEPLDRLAEQPDPTAGQLGSRAEMAELAGDIRRRLTSAQNRVFSLLTAGYTRPEIGAELGLSRKTVQSHVKAIQLATTAALAGERLPTRLADRRQRQRQRALRRGSRLPALGSIVAAA